MNDPLKIVSTDPDLFDPVEKFNLVSFSGGSITFTVGGVMHTAQVNQIALVAGGGGGSYSSMSWSAPVTPGQSYGYTVGSGGAGGSSSFGGGGAGGTDAYGNSYGGGACSCPVCSSGRGRSIP